MPHLRIQTRADSPELKKAACSLEQAAWNSLGFLNYTRPHYELYADLLETFADFQLCLVDEERGYPVATANCVPLACAHMDNLPAEGWDWLVETASVGSRRRRADTLGALAISVPPIHRSKGYARLLIQAFIDLAHERGLQQLIAPVRPSAKTMHPRVPIDDYVLWTDAQGRPYDPWLRSHLASGGKLVGPCHRSMVVDEPLGFWESWSKTPFRQSGDYDLDGGLVPVHIDLEADRGSYAEPNLWVTYAVGNA